LFIATGLGAFAAHGLERYVGPSELETFRIGVEYHFYHALGLLGVGAFWTRHPGTRSLAICSWLLIAGTLFFSGSLYLLAFGTARAFGFITPLGGLCFMSAWLVFAYSAWSVGANQDG